jgi:hypothetical protein
LNQGEEEEKKKKKNDDEEMGDVAPTQIIMGSLEIRSRIKYHFLHFFYYVPSNLYFAN